jgi:hypothetical protein
VDRRWAEQGIDVLLNGRAIEPGVLPQPLGDRDRVEADGFPPSRLIAAPVEGAMVRAAQRHRELIADPAAQSPWLHESEVMGVARLPPTEQAWLRRDELQMGAIAVAARFAQREAALVDMPGNCVVYQLQFGLHRSSRLRRRGSRLFTRLQLASAFARHRRDLVRTCRFLCGAEFEACS